MRALCGWALCLAAGCSVPHEVVFPGPPEVRTVEWSAARLLRLSGPSGPVLALYKPPAPGAPTVVWFHGNGQQLADLPPLLSHLCGPSIGAMAVEYPNYGLLWGHGRASEQTAYEAAEVALSALHGELGVAPADVTLVGQSVGSGVATEMARRGHGARLALISPFTSVDDVGGQFVGRIAGWMLEDHLDNRSKAPLVGADVLLIHGTRDALVPGWMSAELAGRFPRAALFWVRGAGHNDLFAGERGRGVVGLLRAFITLEPRHQK